MIQVKNLTKKYGKRTAVNDLSFEIKDGEIVGFLGPNGAGKSTTMNMLCGYISCTAGEILIDGHSILQEPIAAKKCIGYLPEHPPLYGDMVVKDYLDFVFDLKKVTPKDKAHKNAHIAEIMEKVGLSDVQGRVIKNLSKGYQQRVGFAQALIGNPKVLVLDEPTVGLDPNQIVEIRALIADLGKAHTVILSSHILSEIRAVCDKIIIINQGALIAMGNTEDLLQNADAENQYILKVIGKQAQAVLEETACVQAVQLVREEGEICIFKLNLSDTADALKAVSQALAAHTIAVLELKKQSLSLEALFAELTVKGGDEA